MRSWFLWALSAVSALAQSTIIYQTGFEQSEGYDPRYTLALQNGWQNEGSGGNGLLSNIWASGQQAYIGYHAPTNLNDLTTIWRPLVNVPATAKIIKFSVAMQIIESTGGGNDEFRWSVFNADESPKRLLSVCFDTSDRKIYFIPQDRRYHDTGFNFNFDGIYDLVIWLNFERNTWTAVLNDRMIVNAERISDAPADLTLGDVDAVWSIANINGVGNNYMIFDDYRITAETAAAIPSYLYPIGRNNFGAFLFDVYAEKGGTYSVDVSNDLSKWFSLGTYENPNGTFRFEDVTAKEFSASFYRVRQVN